MHEIARVTLENEMDLILAHKRTMKLAEIAGLTLSAQTTFATAVSEVSRIIIESKKSGYLTLCVETDGRENYIVACLKDEQLHSERSQEGLAYAKRLVNKYNVSTVGKETSIELFYHIAPAFRVDIQKLDEWRNLFRNEPPISPYEELKKKNEQLQELSERIQKSESRYKTLTNALPLIIFSLDFDGQLLYANEWLLKYTGETPQSLNASRWKNVVHEDDYDTFMPLLQTDSTKTAAAIKTQAKLRNKTTGEYLWHQVALSPFADEKGTPQYWIGFIVDIHAQKVYEDTLKDNIELKQTQAMLEQKQAELEATISELNRSNRELAQFAHVASHDLQEPVRKLLFYSDFLKKKYADRVDGKGISFLDNIQDSAMRMRNLILDLLSFSQLNKSEIKFVDTSLNDVAEIARQDLEMAITEKKAVVKFDNLPSIKTDARMMRQLFENLINNALKFSKTDVAPEVNVSYRKVEGNHELCFADNGIGFDEKYSDQMFHLFQRLHGRETYSGTGMGLAICRKIAELHGGRIWAKSAEGVGSSFFVSIPVNEQ